MAVRVPAVYHQLVFWPSLSFLPFCRISKLRIINKHQWFESLSLHHSVSIGLSTKLLAIQSE